MAVLKTSSLCTKSMSLAVIFLSSSIPKGEKERIRTTEEKPKAYKRPIKASVYSLIL